MIETILCRTSVIILTTVLFKVSKHQFHAFFVSSEMYFEEEGPPMARKSLHLASPLLPAGAGASKKRPLEESPLPFMPSDSDTTPSTTHTHQ